MSGARSRCSVAQAGKEVILLKEGNKKGNKITGGMKIHKEKQKGYGKGKKRT
jgi:hypothetical protein